ncbi:MAG TPA: hypothetical protein VN655_18125 [Pseudolabrys sp.]|jgi:hypothetical protein|nr:hypothetical protein [Pseudolabrys sp.]
MNRLASILIPLVSVAALSAGAAHAGDYYERDGAGKYKPVRDAWYSSTCCYKKIVKHITITKEVWVKVPPPKAPAPHHQHAEEDDEADAPRPAPASHHAHQVIALGEVVQIGDKCRKAVPGRERGLNVIVMVNVSCH